MEQPSSAPASDFLLLFAHDEMLLVWENHYTNSFLELTVLDDFHPASDTTSCLDRRMFAVNK